MANEAIEAQNLESLQNNDVINFIRSLLMVVVDKRRVAKNIVNTNSESISNRFRFEKPEDHLKLGSCLYSFTDSAMAIRGYLRSSTTSFDTDFEFLRLFGMLNALYIQLGVIECLVEITKLPNKVSIIKTLKKSKMIQCRHLVASHPLNFKEGNKLLSTTLNQVSLGGTRATFRINETNEEFRCDFNELLIEWGKLTRPILFDISSKLISNVFKSNKNKRDEWYKKLESLND